MLLIADWDITGPAALLVGLTVAFLVVSVVAVVRSQRRRPVAGRMIFLVLSERFVLASSRRAACKYAVNCGRRSRRARSWNRAQRLSSRKSRD